MIILYHTTRCGYNNEINTINKLTLMLNSARPTNDATPIRLNTQEIQDNA